MNLQRQYFTFFVQINGVNGCSGKFSKTIFYFLRADQWSECKVIVTGKPVSRGEGDGMQVPCLLKFHGQKSFIGILKPTVKCIEIATFIYILRMHTLL